MDDDVNMDEEEDAGGVPVTATCEEVADDDHMAEEEDDGAVDEEDVDVVDADEGLQSADLANNPAKGNEQPMADDVNSMEEEPAGEPFEVDVNHSEEEEDSDMVDAEEESANLPNNPAKGDEQPTADEVDSTEEEPTGEPFEVDVNRSEEEEDSDMVDAEQESADLARNRHDANSAEEEEVTGKPSEVDVNISGVDEDDGGEFLPPVDAQEDGEDNPDPKTTKSKRGAQSRPWAPIDHKTTKTGDPVKDIIGAMAGFSDKLLCTPDLCAQLSAEGLAHNQDPMASLRSLEALIDRCNSLDKLDKAVQFFSIVNLVHLVCRVERSEYSLIPTRPLLTVTPSQSQDRKGI